jgi:hypothetical protein
VAAGSFLTREPPEIRGTGYVVRALEAALWAFRTGSDFRSGALRAVNLGEDADTTGAIYGPLAGAIYGEAGIPEAWRQRLALAQLDRGIRGATMGGRWSAYVGNSGVGLGRGTANAPRATAGFCGGQATLWPEAAP